MAVAYCPAAHGLPAAANCVAAAARVAVAALPVMLMPAVPAAMFAAVRLVNKEPAPAERAPVTAPLAFRVGVAMPALKVFSISQVFAVFSRFEFAEVISDKKAICCVALVLSWKNRCVFPVVSQMSPFASVAGCVAAPTTFTGAKFGPVVKVCLLSAV